MVCASSFTSWPDSSTCKGSTGTNACVKTLLNNGNFDKSDGGGDDDAHGDDREVFHAGRSGEPDRPVRQPLVVYVRMKELRHDE